MNIVFTKVGIEKSLQICCKLQKYSSKRFQQVFFALIFYITSLVHWFYIKVIMFVNKQKDEKKKEHKEKISSKEPKNVLDVSNKLLTPTWYWSRYINNQIVPSTVTRSLVEVADPQMSSPISNSSKLNIVESIGPEAIASANDEKITCPPPPLMYLTRMDPDFADILTIARQARLRNISSAFSIEGILPTPPENENESSMPHPPVLDPMLRAGGTSRDFEVIWKPMSAKVNVSCAETILRKAKRRMGNNEIVWEATKRCWHDDLEIQIESRFYFVNRFLFTYFARNFRDFSSQFLQMPVQKVEMALIVRIYEWMLNEEENFAIGKELIPFFAAAKCLGVKELMEQYWGTFSTKGGCGIWEINAFHTYLMARDLRCLEIMVAMQARLRKCFLPVVASWEFLEFDANEVYSLLNQDTLCVNSEDEVFFAAFYWLNYAWVERKKYAVQVMQGVRFGLVSPWLRRSICNRSENDRIGEIGQMPEICHLIWEGTLLCQAIIANRQRESQKGKDVREMLKEFENKKITERYWVYCEGVSHHHDYRCSRHRELTFESFKRFLHRLHSHSTIFMDSLQYVPNKNWNTYRCCIDVKFRPYCERKCPKAPFYRKHLNLNKCTVPS
ncbi:uncharacterized protein Dyak_GE16300 [Drosophila yakuba]|uniref:BACK domain-containing protein n=2 Tax=Drosophila yakuba TaxID=7245 RepID=B4Q0K1_DROYA|nr:uncharacterized protein Dyak_GE16300 [Drosophila yakuba]